MYLVENLFWVRKLKGFNQYRLNVRADEPFFFFFWWFLQDFQRLKDLNWKNSWILFSFTFTALLKKFKIDRLWNSEGTGTTKDSWTYNI